MCNHSRLFIEIEEQASRLGIDPVKELHLLGVAKQCLLEPLPSNWLPWYCRYKWSDLFQKKKKRLIIDFG